MLRVRGFVSRVWGVGLRVQAEEGSENWAYLQLLSAFDTAQAPTRDLHRCYLRLILWGVLLGFTA